MMATRPAPPPLDTLLAILPSMPRPILTRLTARLLERLDEMDGDPDIEDGNDLEQIDDREVEDYEGGHPSPPHDPPPKRRVVTVDAELARVRRHVRRIKRSR